VVGRLLSNHLLKDTIMRKMFYFLLLLCFSFTAKAEPVDSLKALSFAKFFLARIYPQKMGD
jgi:hypothetical protein